MPFELKLAWRYFCARKKSLARFTAFVAILGIAIGIASLILAQSLARGFADEMQDKILTNTAHIAISMKDGSEIFNWKDVKAEVEKLNNIAGISPTVLENAVLAAKDSTNYVVIRAFPAENRFPKSQSEVGGIAAANEDVVEISIGRELAEKSGLKTGDNAELVTLKNDSAKTSKVRIIDTFQTGLYEYDSTWINLSPESYVRLKDRLSFTPTNLVVSVNDIYATDKTVEKIREKLGENFKIVDWQEANQPLFAALSLERKVSFAIISLIVLIAALNITTTLSLLVNERKLDIAVLRTCGASTKNLIVLFLSEGLFLGLIGIGSGVLIGLLGCVAGNYFKLVSISKEVYSLESIPFHPEFESVLIIILVVITLCLAATIYPAFKASKIKPLENLRTQ